MDRETMGRLASKISTQVQIWEDSHKKYGIPLPSFHHDKGGIHQSSQMPRHALDAREQIIDSAFKLLELAAGPSKMISIALSQVQTISALKWLLHFGVFELIQTHESMPYQKLAERANVPVSELKQMLRMVMASHIFVEAEDESIQHSPFSMALAKDDNFLRRLPFFCDAVLPASVKMVDTTVRWQGSQEEDKTAHSLALNRELTFSPNLTQHDETNGYDRLMSPVGNGHSLSATCAAEVVHGTINWSFLRNGALVVNLGSCDPCSLELAELFPHLRFEVHGPQDKLTHMENFVNMKNPGLLTRMNFCSCRAQMSHGADVYLLPGVIHRQSDEEIVEIIRDVYNNMDYDSLVIIVDSVLPDLDDKTLAMERVWRCRDMTMRQLHILGERTLGELEELAAQASENHLILESHDFLPGSTVATVIYGV